MTRFGTIWLAVLVAVGMVAVAPPKAVATNAPVPYTVPTGTIYNIPAGAGGTAAQQYRWHIAMQKLIDATKAGSTITITLYSWSHQPSADALLRADARGVIIKLTMFDRRLNSITNSFKKALKDGKPIGSYFKVCTGSCLGPTSGPRSPASHHAKILTFSQVETPAGPVKYVTTIGTGNLSTGNGAESQNVWRIAKSDKVLFDGLNTYMARMAADRDGRTATAKIIKSGINWLYLYPQMDHHPDPILLDLNATTCKAKAGFGKSGKTVVRVTTFLWTGTRLPIANRLAVLKKAGCDVAVIINNDNNNLDRRVLGTLLAAKIRVLNAHKPGVVHTHAKTTVISGTVGGKSINRVHTGSPNFTRASLYSNDEVLHRITGSGTTKTYLRLFDQWAKTTTRVTSAKSVVTGDRKLRED